MPYGVYRFFRILNAHLQFRASLKDHVNYFNRSISVDELLVFEQLLPQTGHQVKVKQSKKCTDLANASVYDRTGQELASGEPTKSACNIVSGNEIFAWILVVIIPDPFSTAFVGNTCRLVH